jgi:hypothetical protein
MLSVLCLRILASARILRYDLGRQTPHFCGGSVTQMRRKEQYNSVYARSESPQDSQQT